MMSRMGEDDYQWLERRARKVVSCTKYEKDLIHAHMLEHGLDGLEEYLEEIWP